MQKGSQKFEHTFRLEWKLFIILTTGPTNKAWPLATGRSFDTTIMDHWIMDHGFVCRHHRQREQLFLLNLCILSWLHLKLLSLAYF